MAAKRKDTRKRTGDRHAKKPCPVCAKVMASDKLPRHMIIMHPWGKMTAKKDKLFKIHKELFECDKCGQKGYPSNKYRHAKTCRGGDQIIKNTGKHPRGRPPK